jgi:hypothetical protein
MDEIRLLTKDDIEVRVAQTTATKDGAKVNLLLYKNARVDMKILDELYTPNGWKRTHRLVGNNLYCLVEVWDAEKKEWIGKEDVGVESNTEAEKGQASDSFKRACVNWGIGRELYTAPKVVVDLTEREFSKDTSGRIKVWASFDVAEIGYDTKSRTITALTIVDRFGNVRFKMEPVKQQTAAPAEKPAPKTKKATAAPKADTTPVSDYLPGGKYYAKTVEYAAQGKTAKSGEDYRTAWIRLAKPTEEQVAQFDHDVTTFRLNNNIKPAF